MHKCVVNSTPAAKHSQYSLRHLDFLQVHFLSSLAPSLQLAALTLGAAWSAAVLSAACSKRCILSWLVSPSDLYHNHEVLVIAEGSDQQQPASWSGTIVCKLKGMDQLGGASHPGCSTMQKPKQCMCGY